MLGNQGLTAAKFDANVRAVRGTIMSLPSVNTSSESDFYVGLPTGSNVKALGVLMQDVVEPGNTITSETDPSTVTGTTPPAPFLSNGRAWALCTLASEVEAIAADTTFAAEDLLIIADVYGRVTKCPATVGTTYYVVGAAKYAAAAANQRVRIAFDPFVYKA